MPLNSEIYKKTCESFGVKKLSPVLIAQARKAGWGKPIDLKLVKLEIRRVNLACKEKLTDKQRETLAKLTAQVNGLVPPSAPKVPRVVKVIQPIQPVANQPNDVTV